ncbi:2-iminobutanoate/2-iminopropanoate deaminase [Desulfomicrobium macestii]|jgi:2-iminobutanoate/2-iminopropanoate deaminase|uniref:Reactive intermediate/imine deaminase n=2 Tax=Desulfomicrobium TaxID=898 RepID=A0A8G2C3U9_DESNO|nr:MULTISPECIES: Rid family detoxifying hydrolase [Desulfomicrobium]MBE1425531.1 2-iminobutanoate/2-iminopropanoate deaminase [Desulfomicrobium macestii]SFL77320.1 reactive intermediate/imine deaminase [Desulfomicrobium norvegicum]
MQKLDFIATEKAPAAVGPYSQAVRAGGFLYVSGQLGLVPATGQFAGADFEAQARQALANMGAILAEAGCAVTDIVSVDVFVTDLANFKLFNGIYDGFMAGHRPARAAVQVSGLPLGGVVEVKCVALARQ